MSSSYKERLLENISKVLDNETFHDITIGLAEGHGHIKANKTILCSNSQYFASFFNNNNNLVKHATNVDLEVPTTLESMTLVLKFLYTGEMEYDSLSLKDLLDLLKLLELIEEKLLFADVETFLIEKMLDLGGFSIEKVLLSANVCEDLKFKKISNAILDFICHNLDSEGTLGNIPEVQYLSNSFLEMLIEDKRWKNQGDTLSSICDNVEDEVAKVVENDKEKSEFALLESWHFEIFQVFVQWLSGNPDCDNDFKARILNFFDLDKFTSEQLAADVRKSSLYIDGDLLDVLGKKNVFLLERNNTLGNNLSKMKISVKDQKKLFEDEIDELKKNFQKEKNDMKRNFNMEKNALQTEKVDQKTKFL